MVLTRDGRLPLPLGHRYQKPRGSGEVDRCYTQISPTPQWPCPTLSQHEHKVGPNAAPDIANARGRRGGWSVSRPPCIVVGSHREGCRGVHREVEASRISSFNNLCIHCVATGTPIELATNSCERYASHQERDHTPDLARGRARRIQTDILKAPQANRCLCETQAR